MIEWKYAIKTSTGIISLAQTFEQAEEAVDVLERKYGLDPNNLDIVEIDSLEDLCDL